MGKSSRKKGGQPVATHPEQTRLVPGCWYFPSGPRAADKWRYRYRQRIHFHRHRVHVLGVDRPHPSDHPVELACWRRLIEQGAFDG